METMRRYVCGFLFDPQGNVALIRKARPEWQAGKLNGVGGKIEGDEAPHEAMRREFGEEAGLWLGTWDQFLILSGPDWEVNFFRLRVAEAGLELKSLPDEPVHWYYWKALPKNTIPNLSWIIPLALDESTRLTEPMIGKEKK